jgi:hypothetical protein
MEYSTEADSSNREKRTVKVHLPGGDVWFTQVDEEPSQDELEAWVEEYEEEASKRLKGDPLVVNVVAQGLRPKLRA